MITEIPKHIKAKVEDIDWSKTFAFEEMPEHQHTRIEEIDCQNCQHKLIQREEWLENYLSTVSATKPITDPIKKTTTPLKKITVLRGKYEDCIGIVEE